MWANIQGEQVAAFISLILYCIPAVISQLPARCVFHLHTSPQKHPKGGLGVGDVYVIFVVFVPNT